jgi:hypothetical protein
VRCGFFWQHPTRILASGAFSKTKENEENNVYSHDGNAQNSGSLGDIMQGFTWSSSKDLG